MAQLETVVSARQRERSLDQFVEFMGPTRNEM
jgi:hypothetical protein